MATSHTSTRQLAPLTSEDTMYLTCFKQAHAATEGQFVLDCVSEKEAHRVKIALYRTKKKLLSRRDLQEQFPELVTVCNDTSISIKLGAQARVVIYRTDASDFNKKLMQRLGLLPGDNKPPTPKDARESEERFKRLLAEQEGGGGDGGKGGSTQEARKKKFVNPFADILTED